MRVKNLTVGLVVKNYKELCKLLEVKALTSDSKIAQIRIFNSFFSFRREGHKWIITEVFKEQRELVKKGTVKFSTNIDPLLISYLQKIQSQQSITTKVIKTKKTLALGLGIVNQNFYDYKNNQSALYEKSSKLIDDKLVRRALKDVNYKLNSYIQENIHRSLERLTKRELITCDKAYVIFDEYRVADEYEKQQIVQLEESILDRMQTTKQKLMFNGRKQIDFYKECKEKSQELLGFTYYIGYEIGFLDKLKTVKALGVENIIKCKSDLRKTIVDNTMAFLVRKYDNNIEDIRKKNETVIGVYRYEKWILELADENYLSSCNMYLHILTSANIPSFRNVKHNDEIGGMMLSSINREAKEVEKAKEVEVEIDVDIEAVINEETMAMIELIELYPITDNMFLLGE